MKFLILILFLSTAAIAEDHHHHHLEPDTILTGADIIQTLKLDPLAMDKKNGIGIVRATPKNLHDIHILSHSLGRCAGFESLGDHLNKQSYENIIQELGDRVERDRRFLGLAKVGKPLPFNSRIEQAVQSIQASNIQEWVEWLSSYRDRYHAGSEPNAHVDDMESRLNQMISSSSVSASVERIVHRRTQQNSLKVTIPGSERPNEIVVLGGHYDSINYIKFLSSPGADDNASGTSSLAEALRVILASGDQPKRTIEFMWYAAEEVGLWGSADIAENYKNLQKDVIGVMQLDMTLTPGSGVRKFGNISDFTNPWLRQILSDLNSRYVQGVELDTQCGYACSDHASWYRQGFPTVYPNEASVEDDNNLIHTARDVINDQSNFDHAAMFAELAVAFALELSHSDLRQPN